MADVDPNAQHAHPPAPRVAPATGTSAVLPATGPRALAPAAIDLAQTWVDRAAALEPDADSEQLARLLRDPDGLAFAVGFVDGVVRPEDLGVAARNLRALAARPPAFLPAVLRGALRAGGGVAPAAPAVSVPLARRVLRRLVSHLVVDATPRRLDAELARLRADGTPLNLNLLGEAVLGDAEARRRREGTMDLIERDGVDHVSIKASATTAPHQPWSLDATAEAAVAELLPLYRLAAIRAQPVFVNLDMEAYHDVELTIEVFTRLLDHDELLGTEAGIVVQAYLPDALGMLQRLHAWARGRVDRGGAPIRVRLVKGANLPMERVEAELRGWPLATFASKRETDANFARVLDWALAPERTTAVKVAVASHNLFDVALAWLLAGERGVRDAVSFEMLLGMAPRLAAAVRDDVGPVRLYTPVVHPAEFDAAIAYLVRRLEEAANPDNALASLGDLVDGEPDARAAAFARERDRFVEALELLDGDPGAAGRAPVAGGDVNADAGAGAHVDAGADAHPGAARGYAPTPDTDPAIRANQAWAAEIRERARTSTLGLELVAAHRVPDAAGLDERIRTALGAGAAWRDVPAAQRAAILHRAGDELDRRRAELLEVAAAEAGKTIDQSDPEVSEAVDFAHWYAERALELDRIDGATPEPVRLTVVTPPWNFPIAIPAGGMLSALAAGSPVIVKPARAAARCGALVVEALWAAGVPREALQLVTFDDATLSAELVAHPAVDRVLLTGGLETAEAMLDRRADLPLLAETSGKNAIVITPSADYDLAVRDLVASAFGHAGQKCSAASLAILVGQAGRSKRLRDQLRDAVTSLRVGPPTEARSQLGPLIAPADGKALDGLTQLGDHERWFITPRRRDAEGALWSPGVRVGVRRGSAFHRTEYFAPVLGIMTAQSLEEAVEIVNEVEFGLTAGLHSLDPDEIGTWLESVQAGNLYVNRGTTGAIVGRQPFGGWKRSSVGPTTKAGGPSTLLSLVDWRTVPSAATTAPTTEAAIAIADEARALADGVPNERVDAAETADAATSADAATTSDADVGANTRSALVTPDEAAAVERAVRSDEAAWAGTYGVAVDATGLTAERNMLRWRPVAGCVLVRLAEGARVADLLRVVAAGSRAGARMRVSSGIPLPSRTRAAIAGAGVPLIRESDDAFVRRAGGLGPGTVRLIGGDPAAVRAAAGARTDLVIDARPVTESGRLELLPFLREQAVCILAHRYGTPDPAMREVM